MLRAATEGIKTRGQSRRRRQDPAGRARPADRQHRSERAQDSADGRDGARGRRRRPPRRPPRTRSRDRQARPGVLHRRTQRGLGATPAPWRSASSPSRSAQAWPSRQRRRASVKKFVNDPKQFVPEMLEGIALANPDTLKYVPEVQPDHARRTRRSDDKVSMVQGSGSGHEPAHVMAVGPGHARRRLSRRRVRRPADGLRLETHQAAELAEGRPAAGQQLHRRPDGLRHGQGDGPGRRHQRRDPSSIDDDVAVKDSTYTIGRRGVAGNFFVIKAVGAAAGEGREPRRVAPHRREGQRRHPHDGRRR